MRRHILQRQVSLFKTIVITIGVVVVFGATTLQLTTSRVVTQTHKHPSATSYTNYNSIAPSSAKHQRRLEFIHIPKTGGTSVEDSASLQNVTWGRCHFMLQDSGCHPKEPPRQNRTTCSLWHLPTPYWEHSTWNPFRGSTLFTVIRNPYTRILSEYYWPFLNPWDKKNYSIDLWNTPKQLNTRIPFLLRKWKKVSEPPEFSKHKQGDKQFYMNDCHMIPQYDYVFHPNGTQLVPILLRFENLQSEFTQLMRDYELSITLPSHDGRPALQRTLKVSDFTLSTLKLIEHVYAKDFEAFGYEILSTKRQMKQ